MKFLIINGPNLNLLGKREPGIYGDQSYEALCALIKDHAAAHASTAHCFQSNHEGAIIDEIHAADGVYDAIVINPGAYTHYSYAILDALKAVDVPAYEVHISHIDQREPFRAVSVTAPACVGQLYGHGFQGYLMAMDYFLEGRQIKLQVIGDPVLHSKSPVIHGAMLAALGLEAPYTAQVVHRGELSEYLFQARENGVTGFNATMPHKEDLLPLLDEIDPAAKAVGSVNTVCLRDGLWVGYNTDGGGAVAALKEGLGVNPEGMTVTLLGAGGAAKAVALALSQAGAERVWVCNRTLSRGEDLCARDPLGRLTPAAFDPDTLSRLAAGSQLLVNCTNLGMEDCPSQFEDFSFLDALPSDAGVFDLIYHPAETELLAQARHRGLRTLNGLSTLVNQAVLALEHFLHRPLDRRAMAAVAAEALDRSQIGERP